jgi:hypothetical protein
LTRPVAATAVVISCSFTIATLGSAGFSRATRRFRGGCAIIGRMDAFLVVVIGVSLIAFVIATVLLATSKGSYDEIGRGGIAVDEPERRETYADVAAEVRELVELRNAHRIARGEPPLDVDAEVSRRLKEG